MKKKIKFQLYGQRADIGGYAINRLLPNSRIRNVGPFVFLDHLLPVKHSPDEPLKIVDGTGAHPHRGIATLTYILNGEADHFDSAGNHAKVGSGGVQWMKAGNGIIHDEAVNVDSKANDFLTHALQFWVNLPANNKAEPPQYIPLQADEVPKRSLNDSKGWIKVINGEYESLVSRIPNYTKQFIYHVHLEAGKAFLLPTEIRFEYAALTPLHNATINDVNFKKGALIVFSQDDGIIDITNTSNEAIDIILFGGAISAERIIYGGPFVMNSDSEIAGAFKDFYAGKYGKIEYTAGAR